MARSALASTAPPAGPVQMTVRATVEREINWRLMITSACLTSPAAQDGQPYKILLTVPVPYAVLNQQMQERLFHQEVKVPTLFGDKLLVERAVASDVNGRTLISVETSGDLNG